MAPSRLFLSPRHPIVWTQELETASTQTKETILRLLPSVMGLSFSTVNAEHTSDLTRQSTEKHCVCPSQLPDCCVISHLTISPDEGEVLGVAWLHGTSRRLNTSLLDDCDDILVVTDHKPVTKILSDCWMKSKPLDSFAWKQRTALLLHQSAIEPCC